MRLDAINRLYIFFPRIFFVSVLETISFDVTIFFTHCACHLCFALKTSVTRLVTSKAFFVIFIICRRDRIHGFRFIFVVTLTSFTLTFSTFSTFSTFAFSFSSFISRKKTSLTCFISDFVVIVRLFFVLLVPVFRFIVKVRN